MTPNRKVVWASLALQTIIWSGPKLTPAQAAAILAAGPGKTNYSESMQLPEGVLGEPLKGPTLYDFLWSLRVGLADGRVARHLSGPRTQATVSSLRQSGHGNHRTR